MRFFRRGMDGRSGRFRPCPLAGAFPRPRKKYPQVFVRSEKNGAIKKLPRSRTRESSWCPELDSNQHTLRHMYLKHACLPIPPSRLAGANIRVFPDKTSFFLLRTKKTSFFVSSSGGRSFLNGSKGAEPLFWGLHTMAKSRLKVGYLLYTSASMHGAANKIRRLIHDNVRKRLGCVMGDIRQKLLTL